MTASYGGTNILTPLMKAQNQCNTHLKKRVFLLTDGEVSNREAVINQTKLHSETVRVFTFGLGAGCDQKLVIEVARAGRGTSTIVSDNDQNLNGLVIEALATSIEPSLKDMKYGFNDKLSRPVELYRNVLISAIKIMTAYEFNNLKFTFLATNYISGEVLDMQFGKEDFHQVEDSAASNLF